MDTTCKDCAGSGWQYAKPSHPYYSEFGDLEQEPCDTCYGRWSNMNCELLEGEVFKVLPGYEERYLVSNLGRVYSSFSHLLMSPGNGAAGYLTVGLSQPTTKVKKTWSIHVAVMRAFVGERPEDHVVDHKNNNMHCNELSNLEYITQAENQRRKEARMKAAGKEKKYLSDEQVLTLRAERKAGTINAARRAREWGFDHHTIRRAASGETHLHLAV